jgi:hypothetical protein
MGAFTINIKKNIKLSSDNDQLTIGNWQLTINN